MIRLGIPGIILSLWFLMAVTGPLLPLHTEKRARANGRTGPGLKGVLRDDVQGRLCNLESEYSITRTELSDAQLSRLWLARDYFALVEEQSEQLDISLLWASVRYGELNLRDNAQYFYNDQLGLFKEI